MISLYKVLIMSRPSKPMAKDANSKFVSRNSKQEIFSKMATAAKARIEKKIQSTDVSKENTKNPK